MRVAFVTYSDAWLRVGGMQRQMLETCRALNEVGIDAQIVPPLGNVDVVHIFGANLGTVRIAKTAIQPTVVTPIVQRSYSRQYLYAAHILSACKGRSSEAAALLETLNRAAHLIGASDQERTWLQRLVRNPRITVIPNAGDHILRCEAKELPVPLPSRFVAIVGSIEPRKGQLEAVRAARAWTDLGLVLVGYPRDSSYLQLCKQAAAGNVTFLGGQPVEVIRWVLDRSSGLLVNSTTEGLPLVAFEAAALQRPVLFAPRLSQLAGIEGAIPVPTLTNLPAVLATVGPAKAPSTWVDVARTLAHVYQTIVGND